jgi:hypothetical protein
MNKSQVRSEQAAEVPRDQHQAQDQADEAEQRGRTRRGCCLCRHAYSLAAFPNDLIPLQSSHAACPFSLFSVRLLASVGS